MKNNVISVESKDATEIEDDYPEVYDLESNLTKQEIVTPKTLPSFLEFDSTANYINDNNGNLIAAAALTTFLVTRQVTLL